MKVNRHKTIRRNNNGTRRFFYHMKNSPMQQVEFVVLKLCRNYEYLPKNRDKMKHGIALLSKFLIFK